MGSKSRSTKDTCIFSFGCGLLLLATILAVMATVCTIAAVVIHQSTLATSNYKIEVARRRIVELERMINESSRNLYSSVQQQAVNVNAQIDGLNSTQQRIYNDTHKKFNTVEEHFSTSYKRLEDSVQQVQAVYPTRLDLAANNTQSDADIRLRAIDTLNVEIDALRVREEELDMQVNANTSLYDNCTLQTEVCHMEDTITFGLYWKTCSTNRTEMNVEGFYTVNTNCYYASSTNTDLQEAVLRYDKYSSTLYCQCSIAIPDNTLATENTQFTFQPLPYNIRGTCRLHIVRCPRTQSLPRSLTRESGNVGLESQPI